MFICKEIVRHECGMPILVIENDIESIGRGNKVYHETGYLSPFRKYAFQVSDNIEGQYDKGSSKVIGLNNILNMTIQNPEIVRPDQFETNFELLKGQALIAIMNYVKNEGVDIKNGVFGNVKISNGEKVWVNNILEQFIYEVIHYLRPDERLNKLDEYLESIKK